MNERALVCVAALAVASCVGSHPVELTFHTPEDCSPVGEDAGPGDAGCRLGAVGSFRTDLVRADGTLVPSQNDCIAAPVGLCSFRELRDVLFVSRAAPAEAVEIRITGWTGAACEGNLALSCESLGGSGTDLGEANAVTIWCECPFVRPRP